MDKANLETIYNYILSSNERIKRLHEENSDLQKKIDLANKQISNHKKHINLLSKHNEDLKSLNKTMKGNDLLSTIAYIKKVNDSKQIIEDQDIILPLKTEENLQKLEDKLKNEAQDAQKLLEALVVFIHNIVANEIEHKKGINNVMKQMIDKSLKALFSSRGRITISNAAKPKKSFTALKLGECIMNVCMKRYTLTETQVSTSISSWLLRK